MTDSASIFKLNTKLYHFLLFNRSDSRAACKFDSEDFKKLIQDEINSFDVILKQSIAKSRGLNVQVCTKEECSDLMKKSNELQEMCKQARETTDSLQSDVQSVRLRLYEALRMSAEAESKVDRWKNPR